MGEIADAMLEGTLCEWCGVYIGDDPDGEYSRLCAPCRREKQEAEEVQDDEA